MSRQNMLAKIHIAKKQLQMEDDAYRALLQSVAGVSSAAKLDFHGLNAVLNRLQALGFKAKRNPLKTGPTSSKKASQSNKVRAIWLTMAEQDIIQNKSEQALMAYIKRMTKGKYLAPQFCPPRVAQQLIESLKKWQFRELKKRAKGY